jgi:hypothetical protein
MRKTEKRGTENSGLPKQELGKERKQVNGEIENRESN